WVGRQPDGSGFYEEYRFKDDSTIGTWGFADSAATVANDSGEIRLRSGQVTSGNDLVGWVVTSLDTCRVDFAPLHGAQNSFTWTRRPDGGWIAKLHWPADGSRPTRDVEYRLQRRSVLQAGLADSTRALITTAEAVATAWLGLMDARKYGESRDSAALLLRNAVSRKVWEQTIAKVRHPFEPFGARELIGSAYETNIPGVPRGQYVVLQYRSHVAHGKSVVETVTPMKDPDGRWRVSGYYIRPE
ncbi:MAG: DUF4019 domain-containing protein, partial [Gemmatimonadales bacterium]